MKACRYQPSTKRTDPNLLIQAGLIYEQLQEPLRAARCYDRALRSDPWHAGGFYNKALNQYNAGELNSAAISIANALNTQPKYPEATELLRRIKKQVTPKKTANETNPLKQIYSNRNAQINQSRYH
jgi:tetratricopeptide (TPR) repeat protein